MPAINNATIIGELKMNILMTNRKSHIMRFRLVPKSMTFQIFTEFCATLHFGRQQRLNEWG